MKALLHEKELWWVVFEDSAKTAFPDPPRRPADWKALYSIHVNMKKKDIVDSDYQTLQAKFNKDSSRVIALLGSYCDTARAELVNTWDDDNETPNTIWHSLKRNTEGQHTAASLAYEVDEFFAMKFPPTLTYEERVSMCEKHTDLQARITSKIMSIGVEKALPALFGWATNQAIRPTYDHLADSNQRVDDLNIKASSVRTYYLTKSKNDPNCPKDSLSTKAAVSRTSKSKKRPGNGKVQKSSKQTKKTSKQCPHCKRTGHSEKKCWKKYPHLRPNTSAPKERSLSLGEKNGDE